MSYTDNTPHVCSENVDVTLEKLEEVGKVPFEWFSDNVQLVGFRYGKKTFCQNSDKFVTASLK